MQQISFRINDPLTANLFTDIETDTAHSTVDTALPHQQTVTGLVTAAPQIAQSKLCLRLGIPTAA